MECKHLVGIDAVLNFQEDTSDSSDFVTRSQKLGLANQKKKIDAMLKKLKEPKKRQVSLILFKYILCFSCGFVIWYAIHNIHMRLI